MPPFPSVFSILIYPYLHGSQSPAFVKHPVYACQLSKYCVSIIMEILQPLGWKVAGHWKGGGDGVTESLSEVVKGLETAAFWHKYLWSHTNLHRFPWFKADSVPLTYFGDTHHQNPCAESAAGQQGGQWAVRSVVTAHFACFLSRTGPVSFPLFHRSFSLCSRAIKHSLSGVCSLPPGDHLMVRWHHDPLNWPPRGGPSTDCFSPWASSSLSAAHLAAREHLTGGYSMPSKALGQS